MGIRVVVSARACHPVVCKTWKQIILLGNYAHSADRPSRTSDRSYHRRCERLRATWNWICHPWYHCKHKSRKSRYPWWPTRFSKLIISFPNVTHILRARDGRSLEDFIDSLATVYIPPLIDTFTTTSCIHAWTTTQHLVLLICLLYQIIMQMGF